MHPVPRNIRTCTRIFFDPDMHPDIACPDLYPHQKHPDRRPDLLSGLFGFASCLLHTFLGSGYVSGSLDTYPDSNPDTHPDYPDTLKIGTILDGLTPDIKKLYTDQLLINSLDASATSATPRKQITLRQLDSHTYQQTKRNHIFTPGDNKNLIPPLFFKYLFKQSSNSCKARRGVFRRVVRKSCLKYFFEISGILNFQLNFFTLSCLK